MTTGNKKAPAKKKYTVSHRVQNTQMRWNAKLKKVEPNSPEIGKNQKLINEMW